jgi:hypothetical protein
LQEAFAPRIQSMLSARLSEELEDEEGDVENPEAMGDEGAPAPEADVDGGDEGVNWVDNDISFSVGGETYDYEISEPGDEEEMQPEAGAEAPEAGMSDEEASEEYNEELNLESIIRELEADLEGEDEDEVNNDLSKNNPTLHNQTHLSNIEMCVVLQALPCFEGPKE